MATNGFEGLLEQAKLDEHVIAVILFGSSARNEKNPRDIDLCLVLEPTVLPEQAALKRLEYVKFHDLDIHVFQSLPVPIRSRVLKEGKILLSKDEDSLYEIANTTIRSYTYFRHVYETYLEGVQSGP